jgi:hypothetical protein
MIARRRYLAFVLLAALLASISSGAAAPAPAGKPLIADAGDSALLVADEPHLLGGMAWGGHAPYKYSWSFRGSASRFTRPKDPNSLFRTEGLKDGDYDLMVTVTDAAGSVARDTVRIRVIPVTRILEVKESAGVGLDDEDLGQSGAIDGQTKEFPFTIPAGVRRLDLKLSWGTYQGDPIGFTGVNDFDLYIEGPDPAYADNTGGAGGSMPERLGIDQPKPGAYKAIVSPFLTVPDEYELVVTMVKESGVNPIPTIELPSIYRFTAGKAQALQAKVKGASIAQAKWDADFDGRYETSGMKLKTRYGRGSHLATFKVISKAGFEVRKTVAVTIADADAIAANTSPFVVVGVGDTGINPYHEEFSADTYPDPEILRITRNFTRPPWEYIPGYPKGTSAIPITLGKGYWPDEDKDLWVRDKIGFQRLYWIPGTKIIGAMVFEGAGLVSSPGQIHGSTSEHGMGSASVSVGNIHGTCPECLLVFIEYGNSASGEAAISWAMQQPWIDVISNSYGFHWPTSIGGTIRPQIYNNSDVPLQRTASERGQTTFFSAGNGFENAFVIPQSTLLTSQKGPDWIVTVGAISSDLGPEPIFAEHASYTGTGKPVDIASLGELYPSSYQATTVSNQGRFGFSGTSNATPVIAGTYSRALYLARRNLAGVSRIQSGGVIAAGGGFTCDTVRPACELGDGQLTAAELRTRLFEGAVHTPSGMTVGGLGPSLPPIGEDEFLNEGHGSYFGREHADDAEWLAEFDRLMGPLEGRAATLIRPAGEKEWMTVDSWCRQHIWGSWPGGYFTGQAVPGSSASWPIRSAILAACPLLQPPPKSPPLIEL